MARDEEFDHTRIEPSVTAAARYRPSEEISSAAISPAGTRYVRVRLSVSARQSLTVRSAPAEATKPRPCEAVTIMPVPSRPSSSMDRRRRRARIEQGDAAVLRRGSKLIGIGRECERCDGGGAAELEGAELFGLLEIPENDGAALVPGQRAPVADGKRGRRAFVELDRAHQRARAGIPDPERARRARRDDPAALIAAGRRHDRAFVPGELHRLRKIGRLAGDHSGAAGLRARSGLLIGDGQAGDGDSDADLEDHRAPAPRRHAPDPARPGRRAAFGCGALQHARRPPRLAARFSWARPGQSPAAGAGSGGGP